MRRLLGLVLLAQAALVAHAQPAGPPRPVTVAVIIDDMGYSRSLGMRALNLAGPVSYSFLPGAPHARRLARLAHEKGRQVLLHLPMQGHHGRPQEPASLTGGMPEARFRETVRTHVSAIPHAVGVNNHMGSELTPHREPMDWLMEELALKGLFFIDSRTTHLTVAPHSARRYNVPFSQRDVFLDNEKTPEHIRRSFERFVELAHERGGAIAIAHPHPVTLEALEELLPALEDHGLQLVNVSRLTGSAEPTRLVDASKTEDRRRGANQ